MSWGDRSYLVINFIFIYSNYIKNIDFNVNDPIDKNHFCGIIHLNKCEESVLNDMEKYLTNILNIMIIGKLTKKNCLLKWNKFLIN